VAGAEEKPRKKSLAGPRVKDARFCTSNVVLASKLGWMGPKEIQQIKKTVREVQKKSGRKKVNSEFK